ncbi:MAG: CRISPR-associated helicase Cas3' [Pseudomonadota bacterium]
MEQETLLAHVRQSKDGSWYTHDLQGHLSGTSERAGMFASAFGSQDWSRLAGLWHDLGKYSKEFQNYIKTVSGYDPEAHIETAPGRVDHSTAGAQYAVEKLGPKGRILAYLIAGHHAGLPDWYKLEAPGGALLDRLADHKHLDRALGQAIPDTILECIPPSSALIGGRDGFALWLRMLFSCLVDADFLDTEAFMAPEKAALRGNQPGLVALHGQFDAHMDTLVRGAEPTPVNRIRAQVLAQCRKAARQDPGVFSLTVPTGGGKTLSSLAFGLEHGIAHQKDRIIYVIPYTSIIEQTAGIFRSIFGDQVIEHHSNLDQEQEDRKSRLAAENWDAPIIVTTNVQFFESLFAARTSRCRKLHNIANSIVVLDEAQLLPPEFLQPILDVMNQLTAHYGVTFVLSTATQPALHTWRDSFGATLIRGLEPVREIIDNPDVLYEALERVNVELPADLQKPRQWQEIAAEISEHDSVLAIVNTRNDARELHALMPAGTWHLSALMCGQHRSEVIAEIKTRLSCGESVRVVSTQLVEAGVDIDFPAVYRALAGLDSIAQAAGRCNREGTLPVKGRMAVFVPPKPAPPGHLRQAAQTTVSLLSGGTGSPLQRGLFTKYFQRFYADAPSLDKQKIGQLLIPQGEGNDDLKVQFRTAAQRFRLIDESGYRPVIVRYNDEARALLGRLEKDGPERWLMRKLQRYTVNISEYQFRKLEADQEVREAYSGIFAQYSDTLYHPDLGLLTEAVNPAVESLIV